MTSRRIDHRRRRLIGVAILSMPLQACTPLTQKLYADSYERENVDALYMTEDGKRFVVIGVHYHYVFDAPFVFSQSLTQPFHRNVFAQVSKLVVASDQSVVADVQLHVAESASGQDLIAAQAAGYRPSTQERRSLTADIVLTGTRYRAFDLPPSAVRTPLNRTYTLTYKEPDSAMRTAGRILMTPITVTADGVLSLLAFPLALIGGGTVFVFCELNECRSH